MQVLPLIWAIIVNFEKLSFTYRAQIAMVQKLKGMIIQVKKIIILKKANGSVRY